MKIIYLKPYKVTILQIKKHGKINGLQQKLKEKIEIVLTSNV